MRLFLFCTAKCQAPTGLPTVRVRNDDKEEEKRGIGMTGLPLFPFVMRMLTSTRKNELALIEASEQKSSYSTWNGNGTESAVLFMIGTEGTTISFMHDDVFLLPQSFRRL